MLKIASRTKTKNWIVGAMLISFTLMAVLSIVWAIVFGNSLQQYKDVVMGELSVEYSNKTAELVLYWIGITVGAVIIWLKSRANRECIFLSAENEHGISSLIMMSLIIFTGGELFFYSRTNAILIGATILSLLSYIKQKDSVKKAVCLYFELVYSVIGIYRLFVFLGLEHTIKIYPIVLLAFILTIIIGLLLNQYDRGILFGQLAIPFLFLIFLVNDFSYNGKVITIKPRIAVFVLIIGLIIVSYADIIYVMRKNVAIKNENVVGKLPVMAIMTFNFFTGSPFVMTLDMHHPAENVTAYIEMTKFGQKAFTEYIPISGMYSWVEGLFYEVFAGGKYIEYMLSNNVFYIAIAALLVVSLSQHLDSLWILILGTLIVIFDYNRVALILPFILILLSPKFEEKANLWYITWVLFGFLYGLYYPAYGIVIIAAMLPLAITKLPLFKEEWTTKGNKVKARYAILWILLLALILWSMPLLVGMAKHVLAMGDGILYVEGVSVFGQSLPGSFLVWLKNNDTLYTVRLVFTYIVRYVTPMIVVWISLCFALSVFTKKRSIFSMTLKECSVLTCIICPIVCYKFSLYKMGAGSLFNKAAYIIDYSLILIAIILLEYYKNKKWAITLAAISVLVLAIGGNLGVSSVEDKLYSQQVISDEYTYVSDYDEKLPGLGTGFVDKELYTGLKEAGERYAGMNQEQSYYMLFANGSYGMGYDAVLGIKGAGQLESLMVSSYSASCENARAMLNSKAIIGNQISPIDHYYFWKWLVTSGNYIWSEDEQLFYPTEGQSVAEIISANANAIGSMSSWGAGNYSAAFGNSMEDLRDVLISNDITYRVEEDSQNYNIILSPETNINSIDYIYVELDVDTDNYNAFFWGRDDQEHEASNKLEDMLMKHNYNPEIALELEWEANDGKMYTLGSSIQNGKLLIPVGSGIKWLNNYHANLNIWCMKDGEKVDLPEIKKIEFYSLRDIEVDENEK